MSADFFRNYIDIINENSEPKVQLDEGMMDSLKAVAQNAIKKIAPQKVEQITNFVSKVLGKPADQITMADATMANAQKLIAANQQTNEGLGGAVAGGILGSILSFGALPTNMASSTSMLAGAALMAIVFAALGALMTSGPDTKPVSQAQAWQQNRDELDDYLDLDK